MGKVAFAAVICFLNLTPTFSQSRSPVAEVFLAIDESDPVLELIKASSGLEKKGNLFLVYKDFDEAQLDKFLDYYQKCVSITMENINHVGAAGTPDGNFYKRKTVQFGSDGNLNIVEEKNAQPILVYEPELLPFAISSGPKKGYVQYPNISEPQEVERIRYFISMFNGLAELGMRLDPGMLSPSVKTVFREVIS